MLVALPLYIIIHTCNCFHFYTLLLGGQAKINFIVLLFIIVKIGERIYASIINELV